MTTIADEGFENETGTALLGFFVLGLDEKSAKPIVQRAKISGNFIFFLLSILNAGHNDSMRTAHNFSFLIFGWASK
jgi:hypothetical protein